MSLGLEDDDVVWWAFEERLNPSKRKSHFIPRKKHLYAFQPIQAKNKIKLI
jgi:hypothetical protein